MQRGFGRAVRRRREAVGLSQEAMAFEAGVHRTFVSLIERGLGNPSLTVMVRLAAALECSLASLMREAEGA